MWAKEAAFKLNMLLWEKLDDQNLAKDQELKGCKVKYKGQQELGPSDCLSQERGDKKQCKKKAGILKDLIRSKPCFSLSCSCFFCIFTKGLTSAGAVCANRGVSWRWRAA